MKAGVEPAVDAHGHGKKLVMRCRLRKDSRCEWTGVGAPCEYSVAAHKSLEGPDRLEVKQVNKRHTCSKRIRSARQEASPPSTKSGAGYTRQKLGALLDELRMERKGAQKPRSEVAPQAAAASPVESSSESDSASCSDSMSAVRPTRSCAKGVKYIFQPPLYKPGPSASTQQKPHVQIPNPIGSGRQRKKSSTIDKASHRNPKPWSEPQRKKAPRRLLMTTKARPTAAAATSSNAAFRLAPVLRSGTSTTNVKPGLVFLDTEQQRKLGAALGHAGVQGPADFARLSSLDDSTLARFGEGLAEDETDWHETEHFPTISTAFAAFVSHAREGAARSLS